MKIKIDEKGFLQIERAGRMKPQFGPPVEFRIQMPPEVMPRCDFVHCYAGTGLADSRCCFAGGMWWHPACPCFRDEDEWIEGYEIESEEWRNKAFLVLDYFQIMVLIGNLDLALRHPGNNGPSSDAARDIGKKLIRILMSKPLGIGKEFARAAGWDETYQL